MATVSVRSVFDSERFLVHGGGPKSLMRLPGSSCCQADDWSDSLTKTRKLGRAQNAGPQGLENCPKSRIPCGLRLAILEFSNREEQIIGTQEKPQRIVVQRPLSRLQYLDSTKSSAKDLPLTHFNL